jgi:hypothetical protein
MDVIDHLHTPVAVPPEDIQGDQKVCAPGDYGTKTRKNILNSFNHLP